MLEQLDNLDFPDDLALLSSSHQQPRENAKLQPPHHRLASMSTRAKQIMKIKTGREVVVMLQGIKLEEVQALTYLGSVIDKKGGTDADV